mgnify:FL=1
MSKFLEAMAVLLWLFAIAAAFVFAASQRDIEFVLWTALLFSLWALLYEVRGRA